MLYDCQWKHYKTKRNNDLTLPSKKNILHTEPLFEAMALNAIVEEMMDENIQASITFPNDRSSMSGVGAYEVQSLTINGVQRALPTLSIFTESRKSLEELQITTLKILSAPTGHKYLGEDIFERINFVVTDSTSHNLEVIAMVEKELQVNEIPKTLFCNVHPLMMFQAKLKEICYDIHNSLGNKKFVECFLVDVDFKHESFVIKSLR